jgi:hypothetical protein
VIAHLLAIWPLVTIIVALGWVLLVLLALED